MISLIITIALAGLIVWAVTSYIPMPAAFKSAILVIAAICLLFYCLHFFGVWDSGMEFAPRYRHR